MKKNNIFLPTATQNVIENTQISMKFSIPSKAIYGNEFHFS